MKIAILGGGHSQIASLKKAKEMGYTTVLFDYLENPPALTYADFHERISTFNEKACLEAAARLQIDGIMTTGTDQPVYTAAYVANKLGMPTFFSVETARKATHKMHMKKAFLAHGVPNVKHLLIDENTPMATYEKLAYPAVLKPLDSQGQRGIYKVESAEQAKAYLPHTLSFSREDHALMEEYYPNEEITVSCWVKNGLAAILTIADRLSFDSPRHIGISRGHRIPSKYEKELLRKIETIVVGVVEALGVKEGPLYIQLLYGEKGLVVNEAALRIGGAFEEITIEESTGFSIMEAVIEGALGRDYSFDPVEIQKRRTSPDFFSVELFFVKEGLVSSLTPMENIRLLPGVLAGDYYIKKKERMKNIENATARAGYLVVKGDSIQQLEKRREFIYQKMQVLDEYENNLVIRGGRI